MVKTCNELRAAIGSARNIEESEIDQLPYLQAVIKETFRRHPQAHCCYRDELRLPQNGRWAETKIFGKSQKSLCQKDFWRALLILKVETSNSYHLVQDVGSVLGLSHQIPKTENRTEFTETEKFGSLFGT
jgi:hypothetical protein